VRKCELPLPFCRVLLRARKPQIRITKPLGEQLRQRRLSLGLSVSKAAALVNAKRSSFESWERYTITRPQQCDWEAVTTFLGYDPRLVYED
jgi:hypothetical protein